MSHALNYALLNPNIKDNFYQDKITAYPYSIHSETGTAKLNIGDYEWGGAMSSFDRELDWKGRKMNVQFTQGSAELVLTISVIIQFIPNHIKIVWMVMNF